VGASGAVSLVGVESEIALYLKIGVVGNRLNSSLIGSYSSIGTKSPEDALSSSFGCYINRRTNRQRSMCHIISNAHCELLNGA